MNFATQRTNMVESQVRPSDVTDRRIIRALRELPRELFVPEGVRTLAYIDGAVPLTAPAAGTRRSLLPARVFAKLVQAAEIEPTDAVLDIGAGSGYSAAVLATLAASVVALESDAALAEQAKALLPKVGAANVVAVVGDLPLGWAGDGPYDAIVIEGAIERAPSDALLDQLKDGGRLVAIVGRGASGRATQWRRKGGAIGSVEVFDASADVLPGFALPPTFSF